jgi:hypothetical protein
VIPDGETYQRIIVLIDTQEPKNLPNVVHVENQFGGQSLAGSPEADPYEFRILRSEVLEREGGEAVGTVLLEEAKQIRGSHG